MWTSKAAGKGAGFRVPTSFSSAGVAVRSVDHIDDSGNLIVDFHSSRWVLIRNQLMRSANIRSVLINKHIQMVHPVR